MFWQGLQVTFEIFCSQVAQVGTSVFSGSNPPNKCTFWIYIDGINRTKGPFVMFIGHIGVPKKEARQR